MFYKYKIFLLVSLLFLVSNSNTAFAELLVPLETGIVFEYSNSDDSGANWTAQIEVLEEVTLDSRNYHHVRLRNYWPGDLEDIYIRSTESALYEWTVNGEELSHKIGPVGTTYFVGDVFVEIIAIEPVTVPYGGPYTAYVYRKYDTSENSPYWYNYLVPGLGMLKEVHYWTDYAPMVMELTRIFRKYSFNVDRFHVLGNLPGNFADEFDGNRVEPIWEIFDPTVVESGGKVTFSNPGTVNQLRFGDLRIYSEMSYIGSESSGPLQIANGAGNFQGTSTWAPIVPDTNQFYVMGINIEETDEDIAISIFNFSAAVADVFGIPQGLGVFFGRFRDVDTGDFETQGVSIMPGDITGDILLRLAFDDGADMYTGVFSLDGGSTFLSPFSALTPSIAGSGPDIWYLGAESWQVVSIPLAEIIGTWSNGIWYYDVAASDWTKMYPTPPDGDIAAGDFTGDGKADVASIWGSSLYYQDGDTLDWIKVPGTAPGSVTAGDVTGDGHSEIIGTWSSGIWYWDERESRWTKMAASTPTGDIAAGDFTGDGKADVASCWSNGLWYQDGDTLEWTKVSNTAPTQVTAGDVTGDGRFEIIGTWSNGIWYWDVAALNWTKMTASIPTGEIAAGDFTGDGKADVASCWSNGLWYQDGETLDWTKVSDTAPTQLDAGDVTGD